MIAMPTTTPVDGTGVETSRAADTLERITKILAAQMNATAIVDEHDIHLLPFARTPEMTGIGSDRLPRGATSKQTQEHSQMTALRDQLLDTHASDMHIREMCAHIGIAFVGTNDELSRFRDSEIYAGERDTTRKKFFPEMQPRG